VTREGGHPPLRSSEREATQEHSDRGRGQEIALGCKSGGLDEVAEACRGRIDSRQRASFMKAIKI
jgi:hypothetical protein